MEFEVSRLASVYSSKTRPYPLETETIRLQKWRDRLIESGREVVQL